MTKLVATFVSDEFVEEAMRMKRAQLKKPRKSKYNKRLMAIARQPGRWGVILTSYNNAYAHTQRYNLKKRFPELALEFVVIPTPDKAGNSRWSLIARRPA